MNKLLLGCLFFYFGNILAYSQSANIPFIDTTVVLDGEFKEAVWDNLPEYTGFYNYLPTDEGLAENQTAVKLFHNGQYLYVQGVYHDTSTEARVSTLKRDVSIALSDALVMVLDTQNQEQNAYFFALNALGTQVDGLIARGNDGYSLNFSWNAVWKSGTFLNGTDKQFELAIPLKALNFTSDTRTFGVQFYVRDIKNNSWTIMTNVKRNYANLDLRFNKKFSVDRLPNKSTSRFAVTPSITTQYLENVAENVNETSFRPSVDVQYNLTSSLKLDATIAPDFSQIDVDQQVTNLTRFSIFFPERRNFFLESSDLFSNLGVAGVNPFYSRRIGASSDIQFGLKLSGNVAPKTRIGLLDVQTEKEGDFYAQNYATLVAEQQLTDNFTATGFLVQRQATDSFNFIEDYNRVYGLNLNYKSHNNRWLGLVNVAKSLSKDISEELNVNNNFFHAGLWYNQREWNWNAAIKNLGKNYITDVGFTPRLYNYDALNEVVIREGYTQSTVGVEYQKFYNESKTLNSVRYLNYSNNNYFDSDGALNQSSHFINSALFFKDLSAVYYVINYDVVDLKYGFDPLGNGNSLLPATYRFGILKVGYNSANNQKLRYRLNVQKGTYYSGKRTTAGAYVNYQLLPFANLEGSYDINAIDLKELGKETFHLARFTGEIFFNNRLNWTTYIQYNTQRDNFNINSRLQWEYKPLSYVYLVITDNYNDRISRTNWGAALKVNYRLDF